MILALLALLAPPGAAAVPAPSPVATVEVVRDGTHWTANYRVLDRSSVLIFPKSVLPREDRRSWRLQTVRVLTPGVALKRLGNFDALVPTRGKLPPRIKLTFTPYFKDIEAGYDPAIKLGAESVALYADAFRVLPMTSADAARKADRDTDALPQSDRPTRMTFRDSAGPVLFKGERQRMARTDDGYAYVVFGKIRPQIGPSLTMIADPGLPSWITAYLGREMPAILADYRRSMGPAPVGQPTLLLSWQGPTPKVLSLGGSVLTGMVTMVFEGAPLLQPNARASQYARWFVAHESAHFWLGQALEYTNPGESWITEGGAELLAFRAMARADRSFDVAKRLREARDECAPFLQHGGVEGAYRRGGDFRAYYACGALIALAAERANGGDFGGFVRMLIERHGAAGKVSRANWLALVDEKAKGRGYGEAVRQLLDHAQPDPNAALDRYLRAIDAIAEFKGPAS